MTSFQLSAGTCDLSMNTIAFVPSITPGISCASLPSSFPYAVLHVLRYLGLASRYQYSMSLPVALLRTAAIASFGYLRLAAFFADNAPLCMLIMLSIVSCVMVRKLLLCVF